MLVAHRHSNATLVVLQYAANAGYASMTAMHAEATTDLNAAPAVPAGQVVRLHADLTAMHRELSRFARNVISCGACLRMCWPNWRNSVPNWPRHKRSLPQWKRNA